MVFKLTDLRDPAAATLCVCSVAAGAAAAAAAFGAHFISYSDLNQLRACSRSSSVVKGN